MAANGINSRFAIAAENYRADVARADFIYASQFQIGVAEIVEGVANLHAVDVGGIQEALHVLFEAENAGTLLRFVAADAFEDGGAVADHVRENVNFGVVPVDELAVVPDLFSLGDGHRVAPHLKNI